MASKLEAFTRLCPDDRSALAQLSQTVRFVDARRDLICEDQRPTHIHLVLDGWGCRYKTLSDGKRQIVSFVLPGDFCAVNSWVLSQMDHSIAAITRLKVAMISPDQLTEVTAASPRIIPALWWNGLVELSVQREWTLNVGQRSSYARLAHLLVELFLRLRAVGLVQDERCDFPPTQTDLADATGLTAVHVNRTLQELRRDGLIELERRQLRIVDLERLINVSMFNPNYLHLDHEGRHLDANG